MIGLRMIQLRNERKLTQLKVSKALNIAQSSYSLYEKEKRSPDFQTLLRIANFFNVSVGYLLGETDERNPHNTLNKNDNTTLINLNGPISDTINDQVIDESNHRFAKALFSYRLKNHVSIQDVAGALGVYPEAYAKLENGTLVADIVTVSKIADFYGVTLNDLFGETRISLGSYEISSFEREMLTAYLSMSSTLRKEISAHFQSALFNTETAVPANGSEESVEEIDAAIEAELERYRLELEATKLGKTSSASGGRKRDLG